VHFKTVPPLALAAMALLLTNSTFSGGEQRPAHASRTSAADRRAIDALRMYDLSDHPINPFQDTKARTLVFFFVEVECPISNRYAPEINRLHAHFARDSMEFWLVYPDASTSALEAKRHLADYNYSFGGLRDPKHALVKLSGATTTPEAAVFTRDGRLLYRGRIDDRFPSLGVALIAPSRHDLADALTAISFGRPVVQRLMPSVGCSIGEIP